MDADRLDRKIAIQRSTQTFSDSGEPVLTWADLAVRRATVKAVSGEERFGGDQWVAKEQVEFFIRWDTSVRNVSPLDRVVYPIGSVTDANTFDIMAVHEVGRHEGLRIMGARRPDVRV